MLGLHCVYFETNIPTSLQQIRVFLYGIHVFTQYINNISTLVDQELMCSIQFHSFLIFLALHDGIF